MRNIEGVVGNMVDPRGKYSQARSIHLTDRTWPDPESALIKHPMWSDTSLRDGNQSIKNPMNHFKKIRLFKLLLKIGFKDIEIGFPSANDMEFGFVRKLIEEDHVPEDVYIKVLSIASEKHIKRTCESLKGAKKAIIHIYNGISEAQISQVFKKTRDQMVELAVLGTRYVKQYAQEILPDTEVIFQYSPESFSEADIIFAIRTIKAVIEEWQQPNRGKIIINLPATVERCSPIVYADLVELVCREIKHNEEVTISIHAHNDRGTSVAASEFALRAGADMVEGTLFGNGERTGNVDIVNLALNLHSDGIPCGLDLSFLPEIIKVYEECTGMIVPQRHPYAGELVFTAFSGTHQNAIINGLKEMAKRPGSPWNVMYLPIDPKDIGRRYEGRLIRVNSQSGKAGIADNLESVGIGNMPNGLKVDFGYIANQMLDKIGREVTAEELKKMFNEEYIDAISPYMFVSLNSQKANGSISCNATVKVNGDLQDICGEGSGQMNAFCNALMMSLGVPSFQVADYSEHSMSAGTGAEAIAYINLAFSNGDSVWGAGIDDGVDNAYAKAILSALNRKIKSEI